MSRHGAPGRRRKLGSQTSPIGARWAIGVAALVLVATAVTVIVITIVFSERWNGVHEFVVIYQEIERVEEALVEGRTITQRSRVTEAVREATRFQIVVPIVLVQNAVLLVVLSAIAFRRGHQIAGPVFRMSTDIRRAMSGESGVRIQLREKDELKELAQRINSLLASTDKSSASDNS